jgi:hypothetical protein
MILWMSSIRILGSMSYNKSHKGRIVDGLTSESDSTLGLEW